MKSSKKNPLNVFEVDYSPWEYPSNWIGNFRLFFRRYKWAYQRATKGYCDFDWWDLDTHLSMLMADTIEALAKNGHGYPGTKEFPTPESWETYLLDIVNRLRFSFGELYNKYEDEWVASWEDDFLGSINKQTPEQKAIWEKYHTVECENEELKEKALNEALDMIRHIWHHLWD